MSLYLNKLHFSLRRTVLYASTSQCFQPERGLSSEASKVRLPTQAQVVIAGAGIVANSVAYHLVQSGWRDVLVLEQNTIGSGSSEFGSGVLGLFKPIEMRNVIMYSLKLYRQVQDMGFDVGLKQCGSLNLVQTRDRLIALKRRMSYNQPTGLHCEFVNAKDLNAIHPYIRADDLLGAVWVPEDVVANPKAICLALAKLARQEGVEYREHVYVEQILTENNRVNAVQTDCGTVRCEYFVNCAGMWARELGLQCKPQVRIPAYPAEHFYATTDVLVKEDLPYIRDYDSYMYARSWEGRLLVGWFEQEAKPAFGDSKVPRDWKKHIQTDFNHFMPLWERAIHRLPILKQVLQPDLTNSPDNFTPDGRWLLGESPEVQNYFVACGMNGNSLQGSGGIGKTLASWIVDGRPNTDLLPFNVARFLDLHNNRQYLQQRTKEVVGRHYAVLYPHQCEYKYARKLRCSPLYSVLEKRGAVFGTKMAYERALYFDSSFKDGDPLPKMPPGSFYKPKFFDFMKEEYLACREGVGIIDMTSFSKIEINSGVEQDIDSGNTDVVDYLQNLCSNDINIPIGGMVRTGMQNNEGGYENDCILVRQAECKYFMVSPSSQQTRVLDWMTRNLPHDHSVVLKDVTSMYTVINVVGPKSRELMSELSNLNINLSPFAYTRVDVGYASNVMVMSFTHTGEPGYCLYVPSEYALHVYDRLMTVGRDYGARDVGTLTQRFMRIERFIPFWAEELTSAVTPYECGNGYSVRLSKDYFIGKYALQKQKERGVTQKLVMFHLENIDPDRDVWPWGGEPIYRNNQFVGRITSAGYGFTLNKLVCLGFIQRPETIVYSRTGNSLRDSQMIMTNEYVMDKSAKYEIDIAGNRFMMSPHIDSSYFSNEGPRKKKTYRPTVVSMKKELTQQI